MVKNGYRMVIIVMVIMVRMVMVTITIFNHDQINITFTQSYY